MNARTRYKRAARAVRLARAPANSKRAWYIICDAYNVTPHPAPWGSDAMRVQSLLQKNSYPQASLHHALAHRVLNFPSLVRNYERSTRAARLAARMRMQGKVKRLAGNYIALPDDDSEELQDAWRAEGRAAS